MWATPESLINTLVVEIPELRPMLDEHLHDNYGELLPHVFFGDVTRWAEEQAWHPTATSLTKLRHLLDRLDADYPDGDDDLRGLIQVSFLWGLSDAVRALLGPTLQAAVQTSDDPGIRGPNNR